MSSEPPATKCNGRLDPASQPGLVTRVHHSSARVTVEETALSPIKGSPKSPSIKALSSQRHTHRSSSMDRPVLTRPSSSAVVPTVGDAPVQEAKPLSARLMCAYSLPRVPFSATDLLIRPARTTVYRDALGMGIGEQAMIVSMCKSFDFLIGFAVGKLSDNTRTRWGRRKPYIAVCMPIFVLCTILLGNPGLFFGGSRSGDAELDDAPSAALACEALVAASNGSSCAELHACLASAIEAGALPAPFAAANVSSTSGLRAPGGLQAYFGVLYFLYYVFGWTTLGIPYDALGMELTPDYHQKSRLFGVKTANQFSGYLLIIFLGLACEIAFEGDILRQVSLQSVVVGGLMVLSVAALLRNVRERPRPPDGAPPVPLVPSARRLLANRQYRQYLLFKVPMTIASLLPSNLIVDYIKYNMHEEGFNFLYQTAMLVVMVGVFCAIPLLVRLARRYGKREVLALTCLVEGALFAVSFLVPPDSMLEPVPIFYLLCFAVGFGMAASYVLPDAILADVIDYDELHTAERSEGMYTVIESNLQQYVEILGGVIPSLVAYMASFENNGGCTCGCGVACGRDYLRWSCPADIGYACTSDFSSPPLFGDPDRAAPCTAQPETVQWVFRAFFLGVPAAGYLLAALPAWRMAISAGQHAAILQEIARRNKLCAQLALEAATSEHAGSPAAAAELARMARLRRADVVVTDPITGQPVRLPPTSARELFLQHFSPAERRAAAGARDVAARLALLVGARLALWACVLAGLGVLVGLVHADETAFTTTVTLACLGLAAMFLLIGWDGVRLYTACTCPPEIRSTLSGGAQEGAEQRLSAIDSDSTVEESAVDVADARALAGTPASPAQDAPRAPRAQRAEGAEPPAGAQAVELQGSGAVALERAGSPSSQSPSNSQKSPCDSPASQKDGAASSAKSRRGTSGHMVSASL